MLQFKLDDKNIIQYRENTWDTRVFSKSVYEILDVQVSNSSEDELIEAFLTKLVSNRNNILITIRIKDTQEKIVKIFQKYGFEIVEMSYSLILRNLQKVDLTKYKKRIQLLKMEQKHLTSVQQISSESFYHSRYHLDQHLGIEQIKQRNKNWVSDMFKNTTPAYVLCDENNEVISFIFYTLEDNVASLVLGGSKNGKGFLTPLVWSEILKKLQQQKIKQVKTIIQANNIGSLKLHLGFSFEIESLFYGLNKNI